MEENSLPYRAEYAKSGRSSCRLCKNAIAKDDLRLAVMVQSHVFDGKEAKWHHLSCFFGRCRPKDTSEIEYFQSLRWEDQEKIRKNIENCTGGGSVVTASSSKKRKSKANGIQNNVPNLNDFKIEYAKSGKSKCKHCEEYIGKSQIRISKKDFNSETAKMYGPHERWHHVDCFLKVREELEFFGSGTSLPGFKTLSPEDQSLITEKIPEIKRDDDIDGVSPSKKAREDIPNELKEEMKKQNKIVFKYHDQLEALKKSELISLLEFNKQEVPEGMSRILEALADCMTFGALEKCDKCGGQLRFQSGVGYKCKGHLSEWARCDNKTSKPSRVPFKIPKEIKQEYDFLKKYKGKVMDRKFLETPMVMEVKKEVVKVKPTQSPPLQLCQFFIHKSTDDVKSLIKTLGGKTVSKFSEAVTAVISTEDEVNKSKMAKALISAKHSGVPVLSADFFKEISPSTSRDEIIEKLKEKTVSSWGLDIEKRLPSEKEVIPKKSSDREKSMFKSGESVKKVTLKDGLAVDPDSELDKVAHVYRRKNDIYSIVLSLTDVQKNMNSYYKLQVLESDQKNKYWLFRAWGRIGTTIGGNKVDKYPNVDECLEKFKSLFEEKTGNVWEKRDKFQKVPGKMMLLEVSYKEEENKGKEIAIKPRLEIASLTLHKGVQDLIKLIFDIEAMKKTMMEFELDLEKMPLGKISRSQIQTAFGILSELQKFIKSTSDKHLITERTNRFYTLVPHDCGIKNPPLLNNEDIIKEKIEVLNSLMEIEIAYNLLQECNETGNTIDDHYKKLNANIIVVQRGSDEFKIIETYVKNTHAKTHMNYSLEIEEIFKIERDGEEKRYKKFKKLTNRMLLWHGSRLTNFVGILSQGLRKAPPEAPSTGYMFGKGIYFADRVSKSANYCMTSKKNPTGLILLCEVALGQMYELTQAKYIEKLPSGKHSVKGLGKNIPDPKEKAIAPSGAEIPLGPSIDAGIKDTSLLYNEYIVYDVSQVKIQYLLRLNFKYNA